MLFESIKKFLTTKLIQVNTKPRKQLNTRSDLTSFDSDNRTKMTLADNNIREHRYKLGLLYHYRGISVSGSLVIIYFSRSDTRAVGREKIFSKEKKNYKTFLSQTTTPRRDI